MGVREEGCGRTKKKHVRWSGVDGSAWEWVGVCGGWSAPEPKKRENKAMKFSIKKTFWYYKIIGLSNH